MNFPYWGLSKLHVFSIPIILIISWFNIFIKIQYYKQNIAMLHSKHEIVFIYIQKKTRLSNAGEKTEGNWGQ